MSEQIKGPEIVEVDMVLPDYSKTYCIFIKDNKYISDNKITLELDDYRQKDHFQRTFSVVWHNQLEAYLIKDSDLYLSKLIVAELTYQNIEFFTKVIDVTEYNKLVFRNDTKI